MSWRLLKREGGVVCLERMLRARTFSRDNVDAAQASFGRCCRAAGIDAMEALPEEEAMSIFGRRHGRDAERAVYRWGSVGFHGGKVGVRRPQLRGKEGGEAPPAGFAELRPGRFSKGPGL